MHQTLSVIITTAALLIAGCAEFPTSYERIEPEKARLLDFVYEPAEAAPGDTVLLKAIFAGRPVAADELTWQLSKKMIVNEYGITAALDTVPLEMVPEACTFSDRTSCLAYRLVIPDNIIAESPMAPENLSDALPDYFLPYLPQELLSLRKSDLLDFVNNLSLISDFSNVPIPGEVLSMLPVLLQCYTVPMRIYCTIKNDHTIVSGYNVRYNSRFASMPELDIPVNHNPKIDTVGIYSVHAASLTFFDPATDNHEFVYHPVADTGSTVITIDKGYSYFMTVTIGDVDSTLSIDAAMGNGKKLPEQFSTMWYLEFDKAEEDKVSPYDLPTIDDNDITTGHRISSSVLPSKDAGITGCTTWLEVSDRFLNEYFRPQGSTIREIRLTFNYTDAYRESLKKK